MEDNSAENQEKVHPVVWMFWIFIICLLVSLYFLNRTNFHPSVVASIMTGLISITVGALGGFIGARTSLLATDKAHKNALAIQANSEAAQIKGVIQALYAELSCLWFMYESEFKQDFEKLRANEPFINYFKLGENYFSIYDSNSVFIGKISDPKLRQSIVLAYLRLKSLVDSHHLNNKLQDEHTQLTYSKGSSGVAEDITLISKAHKEWKDYSPQLKLTYLVAKQAVTATLELFEQSGMLPSKAILEELSSSLTKPTA